MQNVMGGDSCSAYIRKVVAKSKGKKLSEADLRKIDERLQFCRKVSIVSEDGVFSSIWKMYSRFGVVGVSVFALVGCGGGSQSSSTIPNDNVGGGSNTCPNAYSTGHFPANQRCDYYKLVSFIVPYSGTLNLTSFYGDSGADYIYDKKGNPLTHNGIDFQTSDVVGNKCQTSKTCPEHEIYAQIEGRVVAFNDRYGAVILESTRVVNSTTETFHYAILHMKPTPSNYLRVGQWIPMGKYLGVQWNTSIVNGEEYDLSGHVHLEFSKSTNNDVLSQGVDSDAISPASYLDGINAKIDEIARKVSIMSVSTINVDGDLIKGGEITVRANGSNFSPSSFLGIWTTDASHNQTVATCDDDQFVRGNSNNQDFVEQTCTLNSTGSFEIFVKAKSGLNSIFSRNISVTETPTPTPTPSVSMVSTYNFDAGSQNFGFGIKQYNNPVIIVAGSNLYQTTVINAVGYSCNIQANLTSSNFYKIPYASGVYSYLDSNSGAYKYTYPSSGGYSTGFAFVCAGNAISSGTQVLIEVKNRAGESAIWSGYAYVQ